MYYQKVTIGEVIIEFHNNWLGEETVIVNGQIVSKKSSVWGTNHYFTVVEDGHAMRYILTTRVDDHMQIVMDLSQNGKLLQESIPVKYGSKPKKPGAKAKKQGLAYLKEYDLDAALEAFTKALENNPKDPEVYFHMACAYSILEKTTQGFEALKNAIDYGLLDREMILNHDMLAFLRMHDAFEGFFNSDFTVYHIAENAAEEIPLEQKQKDEEH
ncbi:MAG: tetratricopeptide repeat protein [Bacteroidota bacterium]